MSSKKKQDGYLTILTGIICYLTAICILSTMFDIIVSNKVIVIDNRPYRILIPPYIVFSVTIYRFFLVKGNRFIRMGINILNGDG